MSKLVILVAALFSAFFVIFSCSNLFDNINVDSPVSSETVTLTGIVSTSGRMALPSGSFAATRYTVSATASGAEPVTGSVNDSNKTFSIGLKLGKKWTITLVMEASESTDPTPPESSFNNVFEGTYAFDHDLTIDDVTTPLNIVLVPLSTGSGKINLPISVASNVSVNTIDISGLSASPETYTLSDGSYTIYKIGVPCGAYTVTIDFKNSAGMLVYSTAQTINVFPNMTTDRWVSSGSSGPISSDGTFLVTSALVQAFAQTQIYVGANPYRMHEPSDTNLGTPYAPLATFAAALTRITDSSKDYTIHISGTQQNFTYSITSDFDSKMKSLTLCGMTGNTTDILYGPASGTVLVIATTKPVTIKNLKITNGNAGYKGGGIQMSAGTDVTLGTGALITGNRAFQKGGGVYVEGTSSSKAKLTIENGAEISANTLTSLSNSDGGFGLYAENAIISMTGGSICNHDGTGFSNANDAPRGTVRLKNTQFTMTGGKITGNKVIKIGGNLFVDANTQFTIDGGEISYGTIENNSDDSCGAGMWIQGENSSNKGTVTFKSGKIIGNVATSANPSAGGGVFIYNYGRFIVEGGEISGNSAEKGGAVFVATSGEFKIKGSASIPAGVNGSTGVGNNDVYLDTDAKITISGALEGTASVATITPKTTSEDLAVVVKESGVSDADFAAACRKIAVNSTEYILGSDGKLKPGVVTTPANAGTSISNITESSTVVLTGTISSDNWSDINESLQDLADEHSDVKVAIDLSGVTNLTTLPVTSFMGCTNLESVTLPDTLTSIANGSCTWDSANSVYNYTGAFYGCTSLTSVELPDGLTTIGTSAFCGCENLESINLPSGLTTIGKNAFEGCSSLSSVDIPDTVTRINDMAFKGCSSITEVELPDTMTYIGQHAFMNCTNLAEVNIPSGVTTLYQSAFANTAITSIEIPNTVRTLGGCVFFGTNLTSVTIPSSVTSIGMQCFNDCKDLESVTFENGCSITSLSDGVFGGCSKLTSIEIPSTVTSIADSAFSGCTVLSNITIPNSVTSIGERVFMGCQALTSIEIPANVTSLGKYLFQGCSSLATVILNHSDEALTIDDYAFNNCSSLSTVIYNGTEEQRYSRTITVTETGNSSFSNAEWKYPVFAGTTYSLLSAGTDGTAGTSGTYVEFGDYPQTIKADNVTVFESVKTTVGDFTYSLGSDGAWYYKMTENPYSPSETTYSNGIKAQKGRESWFKVEPIKWCVVDSNFDHDGNASTSGVKFLVAERIFPCCRYYDDKNERAGGIKSSDYKESKIRAWLNGYEYNKQGTQSSEFVDKGVLNTAFTTSLQSAVLTTKVKNGTDSGAVSGFECEDTQDEVFMLSKAEADDSTLFPNDAFYKHYCTDFALASSICQAKDTTTFGKIYLFTRSPKEADTAWRPFSGNTWYGATVNNDSMGCIIGISVE